MTESRIDIGNYPAPDDIQMVLGDVSQEKGIDAAAKAVQFGGICGTMAEKTGRTKPYPYVNW